MSNTPSSENINSQILSSKFIQNLIVDMGQSICALKTANVSIRAVTKLIERANSLANYALDTNIADKDYCLKQCSKYSEQFDIVLSQIDALLNDADYNGINLLRKDNLKVVFCEYCSLSLDIKGLDITRNDLGIAFAVNKWNSLSSIEKSISETNVAIIKLNNINDELYAKISMVKNQEEFARNVVSVLTKNINKSNITELNDEEAKIIALQMHQKLSINSLSEVVNLPQSTLKMF